MSEELKLLALYEMFDTARRARVGTGFSALCAAYPQKCFHTAGYTELWLTAIADERAGFSPWLETAI